MPSAGDFVHVRTRDWLVESICGGDAFLRARLACVNDDAQGEILEVIWNHEIDAKIIEDGRSFDLDGSDTDDPPFLKPTPGLKASDDGHRPA